MSPALRVVVVGGGMVGVRFAEELHARAGEVTEVTVLGAESYEPYNRVLLSDLVSGKADLASLALPPSPGGRVLRGVTATHVDRPGRTVRCDDGSEHRYDALVLATGARAHVPDLPGLVATAPGLPRGVHALRTLDDAREIVAAAANGPDAVVVGGGVLGIEVACGLARRGLAVTVLHGGPHAMDRQLDAYAAEALGAGLGRLGIVVRSAVRIAEVRHDACGVAEVLLEGGERVRTRLLVLTAGTVPEIGLAAAAGLAVARGVVVGADLATADPAVFAIGDCAEPPEGGTGLVAQGWAQARRLAAALAARARAEREVPSVVRASDDTAPVDVVRVKAHGLAVSAMGAPAAGAPPGARCVRLSDPGAARHVEVVVHDGVVIGAVCVGDAAVAADLTAAYTRRTPTPRDPAQLLLRPVRGSEAVMAASPTLMPDRATVCRCNGVTKGDVVARWRSGSRSVAEVVRTTRATTGCGGCTEAVCGLVEWLERADPDPAGGGERSGADDGAGTSGPVPVGRGLAAVHA
jgi:assimilatory nitrate reductase electron transfer subunit